MRILGLNTKKEEDSWEELVLRSYQGHTYLITKTNILNEFFVAYDNLDNIEFRKAFRWFFELYGYNMFLAHTLVQGHLVLKNKSASHKFVFTTIARGYSALCEALEIDETDVYIDLEDMFEEASFGVEYKGLWDE